MLLQGSKSVRHVNRVSSRRFAESPRSGGGARGVKLALCAVLLVTAAGAQPSADWRIDTIAGPAKPGDGGPAIVGLIRSPNGVATDSAGNLYIADIGNHRIRVLTSFTDSSGEHAPLLEGIRDLLPF